jgi:hypothetical protein
MVLDKDITGEVELTLLYCDGITVLLNRELTADDWLYNDVLLTVYGEENVGSGRDQVNVFVWLTYVVLVTLIFVVITVAREIGIVLYAGVVVPTTFLRLLIWCF